MHLTEPPLTYIHTYMCMGAHTVFRSNAKFPGREKVTSTKLKQTSTTYSLQPKPPNLLYPWQILLEYIIFPMSKLIQVMISKVLIPAASNSEHLRKYNYIY